MTHEPDRPAWDVAVIDGEPVEIINRAAVEQLIKQSPLGETEARHRLRAAGVPIDEPQTPC